MKTIYTFTLLLISTISFSQNWQSIKSIDTNYFKSNAIGQDYIIASQIDSTNFINLDSVFYPFKTLRKLNPTININNVECSAIAGDSWLGHKIIIKPNGDNLFFNKTGDTILIKTLLNLNDSYPFYTYSNGNTIEVTVTSIQQETFFGITDSIKTYQLSSTNPSFYLDNQSFKIGKNTGFTQLIPFYNFPLQYPIDETETPTSSSEYSIVGKENPRTAITKPTFHDVYNLEIGDVVQYGKYGGPIHDYYEKEILSKTVFSVDSVEYYIKTSHFYHSDGTSTQNPEFTSSTLIDTTLEKYKISNDYISYKIPEKMYFNHLTNINSDSADTTISIKHSQDCGFEMTTHHSGYYLTLTHNDSLYYDNWHAPDEKSQYISAAFSYYNSCFDPQLGGCNNTTNLISKNTSFYNCGIPFYLEVNSYKTQNQLNIYPNPATKQVTINSELSNLKIFNNLGQLVLNKNHPNHVINLSALPKGVYFIKGTNHKNSVYTSKLIIK